MATNTDRTRTLIVHSRRLHRNFVFVERDQVIYLVESERPERRLCEGGGYRGRPVWCGPSDLHLRDACNRWLRQHYAGG